MSFLSMFIKKCESTFQKTWHFFKSKFLKNICKTFLPAISMCNNFLQIVSFLVQFLQRDLFIVVDMVVKLYYVDVPIKT